MSDYEAALSVYRDELAAERALADDLAAMLEQGTSWGYATSPEVEEVLARWRETRGR